MYECVCRCACVCMFICICGCRCSRCACRCLFGCVRVYVHMCVQTLVVSQSWCMLSQGYQQHDQLHNHHTSSLPYPTRNPEPSKRPLFSSITEYLSQEDLALLHIHSDDQGLPPAAYMLGAPLEEGRLLYTDLQGLYLTQQSTTDQSVCSDYEVPTSVQRK